MFFGAQFLKKYSKIEKNMRISECNFNMKIYSYYGDNLQDEIEERVKIMSLIG